MVLNKSNKMLGGIQAQYTQHLSEPWFTLISLGLKTVEGRKNKGVFKEMKLGDIVKWTMD
jgi:ASC-1-like (ASCH) protein